jgi:Na+/H+-dicarboxylate symporter
LYGIDLGVVEIAAISGALAALSFYSPGIPSGGLFIIAPIYMVFGLPVEGIGLLIALDLVVDMFITAANVTADMTAAVVLARFSSSGGAVAGVPD